MNSKIWIALLGGIILILATVATRSWKVQPVPPKSPDIVPPSVPKKPFLPWRNPNHV